MRIAVAMLCVAACGRVGFSARPDGPGGDGPGGIDLAFPDFADCSSIALIGDATCVAGELFLTIDAQIQVSAAWFASYPIDAETSFSIEATWSFRHTGPGADGAAIVFQSDPRGTSALGIGGNNLALAGIQPSVAIELDPYGGVGDPPYEHVGLDRDGNLAATDPLSMSPFDLTAVPAFTVWIDYQGPTNLLQVFISESTIKPTIPVLTASEDLTRLGPAAWFGLTAATGQASEAHVVTSLRVDHIP